MSSAETPGIVPRNEDDLRLAGVVHDVNQMLTVIVGRAAFLQGNHTDEELRNGLDSILTAAGDAAVILKRWKSSSPIAGESGDLRTRVDEALAAILPPGQSSWYATPVEGAWHAVNRIPSGFGAAVPAAEVREVLQNLLLNALAAMPSGGGIEVTGETVDEGSPADRIRLQVADTGPGVDATAREDIFNAGYSTSGSSSRGVGLAACRQLLARHGAHLELAPPESGSGAVFRLDLPGGGTAGQALAEARVDDGPLALTILVVDDEPAVRDVFGDVLRSWDCVVDTAADAATARDLFAAGRYQVALVDLGLPGETGLELAQGLRDTDPALAIILTTGLDRERDLTGAVGPAVDFTLVKPLDLDDLRRTLGLAAALTADRGATGGQPGKEKK
ncbi:hypothetical protein DRQ50_00320 [bacterium]|nr:MAG: hypothetical protein DRQ50_00320 [bacterium]